MAQYVRLPDNSLFEVREGESPHQAFLKAQQQYPDLFPGLASGKKPESSLGAAFSATLSRIGGEAALTAGKMGLLTPEEAEARYKRQLEKARGIFKPTEEGWTEAPLKKLAETAGSSAAYMLLPAAAGVAGLAAPIVAPGAAAALGTGIIGGGLAGLAGVGQYTGSNLAAQMEENKKGLAETSGAAAVGAAVPQAALDVLSFKMIPGVKRLFGSVGKEVTEDQAKAIAAQTLRQKIGDYSAATGLAMGVEGATEVAQDMLEKLQAGANLTDPKAREDYLENFIGGAALAGVLGPFGRGFERAGIQARGRQLEKERLDAEARAAADEAAALKLTAPEEALGPEVPAALQTKRLQDRLAQIEQEAAVARQNKDMDTLLRLQRERTALEAPLQTKPLQDRLAQIEQEAAVAWQDRDMDKLRSLQRERMELEAQVGAQPTGMEARRQLELAQQSLIERIKATPTPEGKRPLLNELVQVQKQLAEIKKLDATPAAASYDNLLRQEKNILGQLQKTEGDPVTQLKLLDKLENVQEQLTQGELFSRGAADAQQQYEKQQAEAAAAAAAKAAAEEAKAAAEAAQRNDTPILMGFDFEKYPTPPRRPQDYLQGTLFGPAERIAVPAQTEMRLPQLQQAVSTLTARPDLSKEDRSLLERVRDLVMPKTAVPETDEKGLLVAPQPNKEAIAAQARLSAVDSKRQSVADALEKEKGKIANNEIRLRDLQQQATEAKTRVLQLEEQLRIAKADVEQRKAAEKAAASAEEAATLRKERAAKEKELAQLTSNALLNNNQAKNVSSRLQGLTKRATKEDAAAQRKIDKLERLLSRLATEKTQAAEQVEAKLAKEIPLNLLTQPLQIRDAEGNIKTEAAPIQLMADFVRDLSKTRPDTTQSRAALENFFKRVEQIPALETTSDLFAGTEAARSVELTAPEKKAIPTTPAARRQANIELRKQKAQARETAAKRVESTRRKQRIAEARERAEKEQKTRAEIRAENERLEREGEAKTRVTFEKLSPKDRSAVKGLQDKLTQLIANKRTAIAAKNEQTRFRLNAEENALIDAGKATRKELIERRKAEATKQITAKFDADILEVQAEIRAIRGVAKPSEKRAAQLKTTEALQRQVGEVGPPLIEDEATLKIAKGQTKGRTTATLVDVRTGRVFEGAQVVPTKDLTEAQQKVEAAEANRLAAAQQAINDERYRNGLVQYAKTVLDVDLSSLDTDALEYEILKLQAEAEESAALKKRTTKKQKEKIAKDVAEGLDNPLDRIISHDYASRENTPLDDKTADAVGKGDLTQALTSLAKNGSTPFVRMVAQRLLPMVEDTKLTTESLAGKGGEYDAQTDTVTLNKDALTEEDLLHEAGHAATNTVASYEAEGGMTRRQFLKGAVTGLTALKLPNITENMSLAAQEQMFFDMIDAWRGWVRAANKIAPTLDLDSYGSLEVADRNLRGFLTQLEYNEVSDDAVVEMLENGGLKKLQASINASQRAIMAEAAKTSEGKTEAKKEPFTPTKDQLAARTALEKLYAKMQGRPEFKDEYGNVSFKEFVSELLSNKQVRDKIDQTKGLLRRIYEGFLRMLGIEPTTLSDKAVEQAFAMFSPSTANVGKEERLASIMRGVFPGTASDFSDKVPKSITDMVNRTIARNATLGDKIVANLSGLRLRTFIADQWAPVDALRKMGVAAGKIKEAQSMQMQVYMRLFSNMQEYTNAALINGVPELRKDEAGIRTIEGGDAKANGATIATALKKASVLGNQQAVERTFTYWMASLRAKQDGVGFEKLNFNLTPEEMAELKQSLVDLETFFKANPTVKDAFEEARQLYRQHNRRLLDLQVQTKVMSKEVADDLAKGDYIGFYRVDDNGVVELMLGGSRPVRVGNIIDQPYLKELVGGDQHILPFFAGMAQNTALLMSMALKNMQHTNTAYMFQDLGLGKIRSVPEGKEVPLGQLRFKQDGKDYWFDADKAAFGKMDVPFDLVMQGLQGVKTAIPALVKAMAVPANILRKAVRRIPTYTLRQTVRDPVHGWMTTGGNFVPVLSTWRELYKGMTNPSQTQIALKEAALISNNVYSGDSEGVTKMLRDLSAEPSKFSQIMMKLDEFAMQGDAATRAVLYDDFRKRGLSHVEALLYTAETMNFSRRGTSASLHWLSHLTPFFNAQIQGLDAVYRALKGDTTFEAKLNARNALLKRGAMLAGVTMAYALMMEDDEAYKNATPEERYGNWFVRVPGTDKTVRVPIPFELGLIFKSIPEAFINVAYGDKKSSEAVKALAKQAYMSSPFGIPTAVKGPLEVAFNYNMYTDQPVETTREQAMDVDQRYRESTTELAKLLGKLGVLSPVQIDHLVRSYTGSAGIMLLSTANMALRPMSGRADVEKPDMSLTEIPVVGTVFQPTTGRGMVNAAFDDVARYQRAAMTYKNLAASDPEAAREYADKFGREIALASMGGSFRQQMGEFAAYKRAIASNPNLTGAQKREQIDAIKKQEIEFAQRLRKLAA